MTTTESTPPQHAPPPTPGPITDRPPTLGVLLRPHLTGLACVILLQVIGAVAGLAPLLAVVELGRALLSPAPIDPRHLWIVVGLGAAGLLMRLVFTAASAGVGHLVDATAQLSFRRRLADRLGRVPLGWLAGRRTGELAKVIGNDVASVHPLIAHAPSELVSAFVVPAVSLAYLATVDWHLTLITLIPVLLAIALVPLMMTSRRQNEQRDFDAAMGRIAAAAVEFAQGIAVVKVFGGGKRAHARFADTATEFTDTFVRWVRGIAGIAAGMQLAMAPPFVLLVILIGGTALITAGTLAPADLLPFLLLGLGLTAPVAALGHGFDDVQSARAAVGRIRDVLAVPPLPQPRVPQSPVDNRVRWHDVHFDYDNHPVLRGVDLTLEPGTTTAVVGPSGSGKSTLVQLLPRFFDPDRGSVSLGGVDLRELAAEELYRRVSFVFQDVRLLRTSVADNIALAVPHATHDEIVHAARTAGIHERILRLPNGYATVPGAGVTLSGGEAQRISIARALLADTPVLVLDEATSFADPQTESAVRGALARRDGLRTTLVIAHRLSTIRDADNVVVLDGGRIVEQGTPRELLSRKGQFAAFWHAQQAAEAATVDTEDGAGQ